MASAFALGRLTKAPYKSFNNCEFIFSDLNFCLPSYNYISTSLVIKALKHTAFNILKPTVTNIDVNLLRLAVVQRSTSKELYVRYLRIRQVASASALLATPRT